MPRTEAAIAHCERLCERGRRHPGHRRRIDPAGRARAQRWTKSCERVLPVLRHALQPGRAGLGRHAAARGDARGAGPGRRHHQRRQRAARRGRRSGAGSAPACRRLPDAHARRAGDDAATRRAMPTWWPRCAQFLAQRAARLQRWAWRPSASCSTRASASARRWRTTSRCCRRHREVADSWAFRCWSAGRASRRWARSPAGRCNERQAASVAAALAAVQRGARIVRVHDVAATVDALKTWHRWTSTRSSRLDDRRIAQDDP